LKINLVHISLIAFGILSAACGGSDSSSGSDNGIGIQISGSAQTRPNLTAVVPRQGNLTPGIGANLPPAAIPTVEVRTGSTTGACALVTRQDAAASLGKPVNEGKSVDVPKQNMGVMTVDISSCSYNGTDGPGQVSIATWKGGDASQVKLLATGACQTKEKITGLGDTACWVSTEHREIQAFKGATFINVSISAAPNENAVRDLAKKVLDKV